MNTNNNNNNNNSNTPPTSTDVSGWSIDQVASWASSKFSAQTVQKLRDQEVSGNSLLTLTYAELTSAPFNLPGGAAKEIVNFAVQLQSGQTNTLGIVPLPKQYPVGVVAPMPAMHFMVERSKNKSINHLYNLITQGGLYLLHGSRQSGKTTSVIQLCSALQTNGFLPIYFSMEYYSKQDHKTFFHALANYLATYYPLFHQMKPTKEGFIQFFTVKQFHTKKVVLFVDEFDEALSLPHKYDLLEALRLTRTVNFTEQNALYTFVGIGTYGMIDLVSSPTSQSDEQMKDSEAAEATEATKLQHKSPFNLAQFLSVPNFEREEHKQLHIDQAGLPADWEEDIWQLTNGKPGASVWVGSQALTAYRKSETPEIANWRAAKLELATNFANTETMRRMLSDIRKPEQKKLLYTVLRRESYSVNKDEQPIAEHLAACGAIVMHGNKVEASAPIIQQVILFCADVVDRPRLRSTPVPYLKETPQHLDIPEIIKLVVADFDWNDICDKYCAKQFRIPPFRKRVGNDDLREITDENAFQTAFLIGLRALLCNRPGMPMNICLPETKRPEINRLRLDVLIHNHAKYVVELCANVGPKDKDGIQDHVEKTAKYAQAYGAIYAFCVNFVGFDYTKVLDWIQAGVHNIRGVYVHLIHVRYSDVLAFPDETIQPSKIVVDEKTEMIVDRMKL